MARMQVTAKANGYYGKKVRVPGETFHLEDAKDFSDTWMVKGKGDGAEERFVATGGTDGVVGTTVTPTDPRDRSAREAKEREEAGISDNDDRSRDKASSRSADATPAPASDKK